MARRKRTTSQGEVGKRSRKKKLVVGLERDLPPAILERPEVEPMMTDQPEQTMEQPVEAIIEVPEDLVCQCGKVFKEMAYLRSHRRRHQCVG